MAIDAVAAHLMRRRPSATRGSCPSCRRGRTGEPRGAPASAAEYLSVRLPSARRERNAASCCSISARPRARPRRRGRRHACARRSTSPTTPTRSRQSRSASGRCSSTSGALDEAYELLTSIVDGRAASGSDAALELESYLVSIAAAAGRMRRDRRAGAALASANAGRITGASSVRGDARLPRDVRRRPREQVRARVDLALVDVVRNVHLSDRQAPCRRSMDRRPGSRDALYTELLAEASQMGRMQTFEILAAMRG